MNTSEVYDTLLDNNKIAAITRLNKNSYMNIIYDSVWSCELAVDGLMVPVYICICKYWEKDLIDIYIEKYISFPYIPHVDIKGKICMFDLEGVLIDTNLCGLLNQCIDRAINILSDGLNGSNKEEFIREFSLYWCQLPNIKYIRCDIPNMRESQKLKYTETVVQRRKREKLSSYYKRVEESNLFAAHNIESFSTWNMRGAQKNAVHFFLEPNEYIYPPDARQKLDVEFINYILPLINEEDYKKINIKSGREMVIIFTILQPNNVLVSFGIKLKNYTFEIIKGKYLIKEEDKLSITPLSVKRIDKEFLMSRTKDNIRNHGKKILLIGCGSIGGYLVNEIVKAGFEDITLVDDDILSEQNIFRHILGIEYVGQYKAEALVAYLRKNMPHIKLKSLDEEIRAMVDEESINLSDFDIIISATGNHNINRWINKVVNEKRITAPIMYVWNEPLDIGCHVAILQSCNKGCYECFFDRNNCTNELYDVTAYCKAGQKITRNFSGCGGSYVPYGSTVSIKTTAICIDWISRICDGRYNQNVLISMKGDGYYFKKAGFNVSDVYEDQIKEFEIKTGEEFCRSNCEVCG